MNPMIPLYVTLETFVLGRVERMKSRDDRGATIVEYGGLILLVAAIVATLVASDIDDTIKTKIKEAIEKVFQAK